MPIARGHVFHQVQYLQDLAAPLRGLLRELPDVMRGFDAARTRSSIKVVTKLRTYRGSIGRHADVDQVVSPPQPIDASVLRRLTDVDLGEWVSSRGR